MATALKHFEVVKLDGDWGTLRCPRKDCHEEFKVKRKPFKERMPVRATKPCPYCFRVSVVPGKQIREENVSAVDMR